MKTFFIICNRKYFAIGLWEATQQVIDEARQLLKAGDAERSRELYEEALRIRRELQKPPRPASSPRLSLPSSQYRAIS